MPGLPLRTMTKRSLQYIPLRSNSLMISFFLNNQMPPQEEWRLTTHRIGRRVLVYDCVDSTNTQAADYLSWYFVECII